MRAETDCTKPRNCSGNAVSTNDGCNGSEVLVNWGRLNLHGRELMSVVHAKCTGFRFYFDLVICSTARSKYYRVTKGGRYSEALAFRKFDKTYMFPVSTRSFAGKKKNRSTQNVISQGRLSQALVRGKAVADTKI